MRTAALLITFLLAASRLSFADLVITQSMESPMQSGTMTVKVKGDKIRSDMAGKVSTIFDASGDMTTIMHAQKMYMKVSQANLHAMANQMRNTTAQETQGQTPKLKPTGQKKTINGFETEGYSFENGRMKVVYWITLGHPQFKELMDVMNKMQKGQAAATMGLMPNPSDFPGLPVRTEMEVAGQKIVTTLVSVKEEPVSDSDFTVPADYQEMQIPALPGAAGAPH